MGTRLELQAVLEALTPNVYFQPPSNIQISYPCIVYNRYRQQNEFADNLVYNLKRRYQVTVIDTDPDSLIPDQVGSLPSAYMVRHFTTENLNHDVYYIYF